MTVADVVAATGVPPADSSHHIEISPAAKDKGRIRTYWSAMGWGTRLAAIWFGFIVFAAIFTTLLVTFGFEGASIIGLQDPDGLPFLTGSDAKSNEGPSLDNWLGTDNLGRDIFSRIMHGSRISLTVSLAAVLFGMTFGLFLGCLAGFKRGKVETVIMSVVDVILAFPALILLLIMVIVLGRQTLSFISLTIGLLAIPPFTRVARANSLSVSNREYVMAARAIGTKQTKILFREIIPNVAPSVFGYALVYAALIIAVEGALAFLGLSVQPPTATWGQMLNEARGDIKLTVVPALWPAAAFFFTVLSLNTLGDFYRSQTSFKGSAL